MKFLFRRIILSLCGIIYLQEMLCAQEYSVDISAHHIKEEIDKLSVLGSVLYFAAHPDDENTRLIAWLAGEKKYKTAYLSLTRGDGGQNLIGKEIGTELGLIRTQELLAARKIDGGEQFFSSAYDFGFSKTPEETFIFWDKETILREAVWLIRKFRPDIIITRFPPDPRGGHGHHQASAILAHEAFRAAADKNVFPEQLDKLDVWQAKRIMWNTANFGGMNNTSEDQLKIDVGHFNSLKGLSYGEIAAFSRSQHKSQGFGAASQKGKSIEYFDYVDGENPQDDLFEGINTTWEREEDSQNIKNLVHRIQREFDWENPQLSVDNLFKLKKELERRVKQSYWAEEKLKDVNSLILKCAGITAQSFAEKSTYALNEKIKVKNEIIVRRKNPKITLLKINNLTVDQDIPYNELLSFESISDKPKKYSQPFWIEKPALKGRFDLTTEEANKPENTSNLVNRIVLSIGHDTITTEAYTMYKYVDPVRGEVIEPLSIVPELTVSLDKDLLIFTSEKEKEVSLKFTNNNSDRAQYSIDTRASAGFEVSPKSIDLQFQPGQTVIGKKIVLRSQFNNNNDGKVELICENEPLMDTRIIQYDHIPKITWHKKSGADLRNIDLTVPFSQIGYIEGAGDKVAESLSSIGVQVDILEPQTLHPDILKKYDAIVIGVRALNTVSQIKEKMESLLEYVEKGGVLLLQYNVADPDIKAELMPRPFTISRSRVTEEDSPVTVLNTELPVLNYPHKISEQDFNGWVQERGLYFAENIDSDYQTPLLMNDKGENAHQGSLLILPYGKGRFVYTSLSFFRQLPAGVPGAYRLFINLLSLK